jgi:hypothetical protein
MDMTIGPIPPPSLLSSFLGAHSQKHKLSCRKLMLDDAACRQYLASIVFTLFSKTVRSISYRAYTVHNEPSVSNTGQVCSFSWHHGFTARSRQIYLAGFEFKGPLQHGRVVLARTLIMQITSPDRTTCT